MISITSTELNYLVFRYLHESGFSHSAFSLGFEAGLNKTDIDGNLVPPGALVTFIQKGIQFLELEANLTNDDLDTDEDFQFLHPLDLITRDVSELQRIVKEKKAGIQKDKLKGKEKELIGNGREPDRVAMEKDRELTKEKEKEMHHRDQEKERDRERLEKENERQRERAEKEKTKDKQRVENLIDNRLDEYGTDGGEEPMDICTSSDSIPCEIPSSDVAKLLGHTSEVSACAWNPTGSLLASSSGDSTVRIWTVGGLSTSAIQNGPPSVVLRHSNSRTNEKSQDVTTVEWNVDGMLLASGSFDGQARIWSKDGELIGTLSKHKGPIFSSTWNKKGDYLLSGSVDKTAIVWDVKTGECKQEFKFHTAPVLDADWKNNVTFATCSSDGLIYVCKVGENRPIRCFSGHQSEVNAIKWDPTCSLLASGSDDHTAKIWSMKQDTCLLDLREHSKEIYTVRWSPTGPGTDNPNQQLMLASASFDSTIKLWDVESGRILHSLNGHSEPVYSVAFSPNSKYLASGSIDRCLNIWSVKEGKIIRTFSGNGGIFDVCWNKEGDKLAAAFSDNVVCVIDFRM